jgi:hypothetical protein
MPRGKTDVDWTILSASKLPGVGQYNISSRPKTSPAIVLTKKGTTQLDLIIKRAAELPGPGDYDILSSTPVPGGLEMFLLGQE